MIEQPALQFHHGCAPRHLRKFQKRFAKKSVNICKMLTRFDEKIAFSRKLEFLVEISIIVEIDINNNDIIKLLRCIN